LILLGGEPGIGKSTLALQLAKAVPNTLYISAEESVEQIKLRADRLKIISPTLKLGNEDIVESIIATCRELKPALVIVDSIQTIFSEEVEGEPGNVNQIRACTVKLLETAKTTGTAIVLVSHVTKDGTVTGPRTLEHIVDTVLYLEGDRYHIYRILRTIKNRFGATDEVGIFQMAEHGLEEVTNPSASFLQERGENSPGNILTCLMEGTRPLLIEIQALVTKTAFGYPARKASGFDINRLHVLIAVLQKRAGLKLEQYDVHINVVGGLEAKEPGADLAVAMAIASAYKDKALGNDLVVFGEVGLSGEVRPIAQTEKRIKECEQLGLKRAITNVSSKFKMLYSKLRVIEVKNIQALIKHT
jgi:DNA repair protein RadA/Sms